MNESAIRSGKSFQTSPAALRRFHSTATMPSRRFARSRPCTPSVAKTKPAIAAARDSAPAAKIVAIAAIAAETTLAPEIAFGEIPARAIAAAALFAQRVSRLFNGRRLTDSDVMKLSPAFLQDYRTAANSRRQWRYQSLANRSSGSRRRFQRRKLRNSG